MERRLVWSASPRGKIIHSTHNKIMNKIAITLTLAAFGTAAYAQEATGTKSTATTTTHTSTTVVTGDEHCLAQADEKTWNTLGLNQDQITRVEEIQKRYAAMNTDRGTENTMRGTSEDSATPKDTDRSMGSGTDRDQGTTGTTGSDRNATTGSDDRMTNTTGRNSTEGTTTTTTGRTGTDKHGTTTTGRDSDQLGYDDTHKEAMERELRTVLTTAQFDRYKEWCQDQDSSRGDSNTDMDR